MEAATGQIKLASSALYPHVDIVGHGGIGLGGDASGINGILVRADWEADLWGRVRYGRAAARAGQGAASADLVYARNRSPRWWQRAGTSLPSSACRPA